MIPDICPVAEWRAFLYALVGCHINLFDLTLKLYYPRIQKPEKNQKTVMLLLSGPTGSGKSSIIKILAAGIPNELKQNICFIHDLDVTKPLDKESELWKFASSSSIIIAATNSYYSDKSYSEYCKVIFELTGNRFSFEIYKHLMDYCMQPDIAKTIYNYYAASQNLEGV